MESSSSSSTTHPVTPNSSITNNSNSNNSTSTRSTSKKTADTDLKGSIIEFMRHRPFLWNSKHPDYKDHKRRENEFQLFSNEIGCSVQEIKRVWHVLRTNFFRAHKLLMERPPHNGENNGGERLWKYYLAMEFILEGTGASPASSSTTAAADTDSSSKDLKRETRSSKLVRVGGSGGGGGGGGVGVGVGGEESKSNSRLNQRDVSNYIDSNDDDHLYARSLTATLRRFDPSTRELIKLKFQEIIVNYSSSLR